MVDAPNTTDGAAPSPAPESKSAGFLSTTMGKIVVGAAALVVVLIVLGAILWFFVLSGSGTKDSLSTPATIQGSATAKASAGTTEAAVAITDPAEKPLESTFTFRNVFAPTIKAPKAPATTSNSSSSGSSSGSTTTSTTPKIPADTLYLQSISTIDGVKKATLIWNGNTYVLAEGDTIPNSPWKVLEIDNSTVVMLFGDTQVTLSTGQGLTK